MNQNDLNKYLNIAKSETIDFDRIERKQQALIRALPPKNYMHPRVPIMTAMGLLAIVSILGISNYRYQQTQQAMAFNALVEERDQAMNLDYTYTTLMSAYNRNLED